MNEDNRSVREFGLRGEDGPDFGNSDREGEGRDIFDLDGVAAADVGECCASRLGEDSLSRNSTQRCENDCCTTLSDVRSREEMGTDLSFIV